MSATRLLAQALGDAGLDSLLSFDLRSARRSLVDPDCCPCPIHSSSECTCQYIVYLVRDGDQQSLSIELHGHGDETYMTVIPPGDGQYNESLLNRIGEAINQVEANLGHPPDQYRLR
jgi:hypothetical protein